MNSSMSEQYYRNGTAIFVLLTISHWNFNALTFAMGDPGTCLDKNGEGPFMFEVLPGYGWDNLVNENRGAVVHFNYLKCKTTEDRRYLIPDELVTFPIKASQLHVVSNVFDHWSKYMYESDMALSINISPSVGNHEDSITASFSPEYEQIKKSQLKDNSFTTKVMAKFVRYTARLVPDPQLDQSFRDRLLKIADHIQQNRNQSAKYESELLVRDFGTHVITSVDAGGSIAKVDQVDSALRTNTTINNVKIKFLARISLYEMLNLDINDVRFSYTYTTEDVEKYEKNVKSTNTIVHGGQPMNPENFQLNKWINAIENDLVAVDRKGFPLDYFISTTTLPQLSENLVQKIVESVQNAILSYFQHNTYRGCTNPGAPNFSESSNLDDGTCQEQFSNLSFGGVYQKCSFKGNLIDNENLCDTLVTKNPKTQALMCPTGFEKVLLYKGTKTKTGPKCHKCWIFFTCCEDNQNTCSAEYTSYWCQAKAESNVQKESGFLFGGLYSDKTHNLVTQEKTCPQYFNSVVLASNINICISDFYKIGRKSAMLFGGFFSCQNGNPLIAGIKSCPAGFHYHLAAVENDCGIFYCVKAGQGSDIKLPRVRFPPFTDVPPTTEQQTVWTYYIKNYTVNIAVLEFSMFFFLD